MRRFDIVEVVLISSLTAVMAATAVTYVPVRSGPTDTEAPTYYAAQFGTKQKYSNNAEEWLIRDFFGDRRGGIFVDVGANHYRKGSNTYFLEERLGWSGLAIDAQEEYAADYAKFRTRTRYLTAFVSDNGDSPTPLFVPPAHMNRQIASGQERFVADSTGVGEIRNVPTVTLNAVLRDARIARFDFLSLDIELYEPKALAGFDIDAYRPTLVCVEAHLPVRQRLLDYFARHDYVVVGKYLRTDTANLYFMPIDRATEPDLPRELQPYTPDHR